MKAVRISIPLLLAATLAPVGAESLWSPDFKGYVTGGGTLAAGDVLVVEIDASSKLSFASSNNDSKTLTLEFTGGETGNLFSFLPRVSTGGAQSSVGKEDLSLKTQIPVLVSGVGQNGLATVQGSRTVTVEGKDESITVTGSVSPKQINGKNKVSFSQLVDARLVFRTFLRPSQDTLSARDLQKPLTPPETTPGAAAAASGVGQPSGTTQPSTAAQPSAAAQPGAASAQAAQTTLALPDAKKKELLLLYLNRLIDILFSP